MMPPLNRPLGYVWVCPCTRRVVTALTAESLERRIEQHELVAHGIPYAVPA